MLTMLSLVGLLGLELLKNQSGDTVVKYHSLTKSGSCGNLQCSQPPYSNVATPHVETRDLSVRATSPANTSVLGWDNSGELRIILFCHNS